jgi:hypothetical protein
MSDYLQVPTLEPVTYDISNQTGCVPVEEVLSTLHGMVVWGDAIKIGEICFFAGLALGIITMYFWYRGRVKDDS